MIELLIGPIASGKSTWTSQRAKEGAIVLNDDSIVTSLHGGDHTLYNPDLKPIYKGIPLFVACMSVYAGRNVIVDSTNLNRLTRARWIGFGKMLDVPVIGITFPWDTAAVHAGRRFEHDARGLSFDHWLTVARHHETIWQAPEMAEGFDNLVPVEVARDMIAEGNW